MSLKYQQGRVIRQTTQKAIQIMRLKVTSINQNLTLDRKYVLFETFEILEKIQKVFTGQKQILRSVISG